MEEKKYIDAEKLVDFIDNNSAAIDDEYEKTYTLDDIQAYLNAIPAADVAEVRHGVWLDIGGRVECSKCHNKDSGGNQPVWYKFMNFCPDCGCKMDGDAK